MRLGAINMRNTAIKLWLAVTAALLCLLVGVKPVQAYEKNTFLYVDGTYMIKKGELLTNKVEGGKGTAIYDEKTNTLTLISRWHWYGTAERTKRIIDNLWWRHIKYNSRIMGGSGNRYSDR